MFCVYLTIYKGNKLPPFYIGSTSISNIKQGYRGSVSSKIYKKIFMEEVKHNPELFVTKIIKSFNTRKRAYKFEEKIHKSFKVNSNILYINKSIANSRHNRGDVSKPIYRVDEHGKVKLFKSITAKNF